MIFDELWEVQRARAKLRKTFDRLISQAKKEDNNEKRDRLIDEFLMELDLINDKINMLESERIQKEAERLGIPVPPLSDKESWEKGFQPNTVFLGVKVRLQLRSGIRKERREQWEGRTLWISGLLGLIIGLIGAITALVSVLKK